MEIKNAIIESITIDDADRGFLNMQVNLSYGRTGQGFGGYALYLPESFDNHELKSIAGHFIWRVMEIAGVSRLDNAKGKSIRVRVNNGIVEAIGHILNEDWLCPKEDFKDD